jgi:hypothetical protein
MVETNCSCIVVSSTIMRDELDPEQGRIRIGWARHFHHESSVGDQCLGLYQDVLTK